VASSGYGGHHAAAGVVNRVSGSGSPMVSPLVWRKGLRHLVGSYEIVALPDMTRIDSWHLRSITMSNSRALASLRVRIGLRKTTAVVLTGRGVDSSCLRRSYSLRLARTAYSLCRATSDGRPWRGSRSDDLSPLPRIICCRIFANVHPPGRLRRRRCVREGLPCDDFLRPSRCRAETNSSFGVSFSRVLVCTLRC